MRTAIRRPGDGARAALLAAAAAFGVSPAAGQVGREARDVHDDIGAVRGPLSDFWVKVRSEWSGYRSEDPLPNPGGGPLNQKLRTPPLPTRAWVSLVHGAFDARPDGRAMAGLYKEFLHDWRRAEGRNWPYAQLYERAWDRMSATGRSQNIIMVGTPWELPPVGPLAESLGITIGPGRVDVGRRRYRGDNLLLIFIAPNPHNPDKYALVLTGSHDEAVLQAGHLPYGETDYVLFRGRRLLEAGRFAKEPTRAWGPPESYESAGSHAGFAIRESPHYTIWYEPRRLTSEQVDALARRKEAEYPALAALAPAAAREARRITYYLYPTVDRKIDETSRNEVAHVDLAAGEIHAVYSEGQAAVEPYLDLMVLLHRALGPTPVPHLERALAIALAPSFQGRDVESIAGRVLTEVEGRESAALDTLRDQRLTTPADGPPSARDLLLAGFLQDLLRRHGAETAFRFVSTASPQGIDEAFRRAYRRRLGDALDDWAADLRRAAPEAEGRAADARAREASPGRVATARGLDLLRRRLDVEAAAALEESIAGDPSDPAAWAGLARARFRRGEFDASEKAALEATRACAGRRDDGCPEAEAWAHLTLGRIEALRGRLVAAHVELTHASVAQGPQAARTLADYWLLTMGQSRNQLTVVSHLKRRARVFLRNLDWDEAEAELKSALAIDPTDGEAHRLLGDVYHRQHEYWAWQVRYLNEVHPDYQVLSRVLLPRNDNPIATRVEMLHTLDSFNDLVLRGNLELLKAQRLYAVEIENLHSEGDRVLLERRDPGAALAIYRRALDLNKDFFLSHFLVGRCLFLMRRPEEARRSFETVVRLRPSDPLVMAWTHTYLGYLSLEADDLKGAQRSFERALSQVASGKAAALAREGLGKVGTVRLLEEDLPGRR